MSEVIKIKEFVICSNKTYKSKTLNIMRDCLIMWSRQRANAIDITYKCPIHFIPKEFNGVEWYFVRLSDRQSQLYKMDESYLHIDDIGDLNPLILFDEYISKYIGENH
jgi:hypothetical protein